MATAMGWPDVARGSGGDAKGVADAGMATGSDAGKANGPVTTASASTGASSLPPISSHVRYLRISWGSSARGASLSATKKTCSACAARSGVG